LAGLPDTLRKLYTKNEKRDWMRLLSRLPGFVTILIIGLALIGYGLTLPELKPNWVLGIGIALVVVAILAVTVVK